MNNGALKCTWFCKKDMDSLGNRSHDIRKLWCNMWKRQIAYHFVLYALVKLMEKIEGFFSPCIIIMRKHDSFWHARCAWSVNKSATVSRFDSIHSLLHKFRIYPFSFWNKFRISDNFTSEAFIFKLVVSIKNDQINLSALQQRVILCCIFSIFS